jgi:hypothetical protein
VVVCPVDLFKRTVKSLAPIFVALKETPLVIIPPMPRWIFERCCYDHGHCTNLGSENYGQKLLTDFMALRGVLIRQMVGMGVKNFKVMDSCCTTTCAPTANTTTRLDRLWVVPENDGVHFKPEGYTNLADRCTVCIKGLVGKHGKGAWASHFFLERLQKHSGSKNHSSEKKARCTRTRHARRGGGGMAHYRGRHPPRGFHPYRWN